MTATLSDTTEYFYTPALKGLVQQLVHLAFFGDGLSVVVGQKGSGKSALASEILGHLGQAQHIASVCFTADLELPDFLERVSIALGIPLAESLSVGEMLAELRHYVQALTQEKKLAVLVIDDAHFMDDQSIGALISLVQGRFESNIGLHLIFFSEPGLDSRIDDLQILDVAVYDFAIPNFSPSELGNFLQINANDDIQTLGSSQIQKAWSHSKGLPGPALDFFVNRAEEEEPANVGRLLKLPWMHIAAVFMLASALLWIVFMRDSDEPEALSSAAVAESPVPTPAQAASEKVALFSPVPAQSPVVQDQGEQAELSALESVIEANIGKDDGASHDEAELAPQRELSVNEPEGTDVARAVSSRLVRVAPSPKPPEPTPLRAQSELTESEAFLMGQDPNHYVLQVIATSNRSSLDTYIRRQQNKDSLKMYRGEREGRRWFVVVQGVYETRDLALNARKNLPDEQAKAGPWPRKLSSIKEEIENFQLN